ncbi:MAG: hypothetical protein ACD_63C00157G0004 [uncultured bacterium]|nr:MAG: hypothetical protein ACD_63C00157G0004 [uncultured bacterium]
MPQINTNLLPDYEKKILQLEKNFKIAIWSLVFAILGVLTIGGFLYGVKIIVNENLNGLEKQIEILHGKESESEEGQIRTRIQHFNEDLNFLEKITKEHPEWTNVIAKIIQLTPDEIRLKTLEASTKNIEDARGKKGEEIKKDSLKITGTAKTRDHLLNFQKSLESSDLIKKVEAPLSNIIKKEEVEFEITIEVNPDYLYSYAKK